MKPPTKMTVDEWADKKRILSPEASAEPGRWNTNRVPFMREVMETYTNPSHETIVFWGPTQISKTEIINNCVGYTIDQDPAPILIVEPTLDSARIWSKKRLSPMLRDTPCLKGKIKTFKEKKEDNTILQKMFRGGHMTIAGANSPASLASQPICKLFCDEIDKFPQSAGPEGDPIALAEERTTTFWNRKHVYTGTATIKGNSPIEKRYELTDQRKYFVPCPHCGFEQILQWVNIIWDGDDTKTARYLCEKCKEPWNDAQRINAIRKGRWIAQRPGRPMAGFWINGLYSPWLTHKKMVEKYLDKKKSPETYQVWVNTFLAETYEEVGIIVEPEGIMKRAEEYGPLIPRQVCILTCAVDVQDDRLEAEVKGWGEDEESWGIVFKQFVGIPSRPTVWNGLDNFLSQTFEHELGIKMRIAFTLIDSGGHFTQDVYKWTKKRAVRNIYACKGSNVPGQPINARVTYTRSTGSRLLRVGTDTAKSLIYSRLAIEEHGPGFMHWPIRKEFGFDKEYYNQLTAEKIVNKKTRTGFTVREWRKIRNRNEALDLNVYQLAALAFMNTDLKKLKAYVERVAKKRKSINETKEENVDQETGEILKEEPPKPIKRTKKNYATDW
jgi:phage terminase large subunit GpA-like protein